MIVALPSPASVLSPTSGATERTGRGSSSSSRISKAPMVSRSPARSGAFSTGTRLTSTPLVLFRSWTDQPSASRRISAW